MGDMMKMKKEFLIDLKNDIKNGTSHSVSYLLSDKVEDTLSKTGIQIRKIFSPLLRWGYKGQTSYKLVKEKKPNRKKNKTGKIFVLNHRQADDIVLGVNAVGESGYIVFGNKHLALETTNGLGLWAYGMILFDRDDDLSRSSVYKKMKYVIQNGGNIFIWSEGYWNLDDDGLADEKHKADNHNSENWLVQDINIGAIRLAQETGCPIIPTILHYDETEKEICYSEKGNAFYVSQDNDIFEKKDELVEKMTTMYFGLMEKYSSYERSYLEKDGISLRQQWEMLKRKLVSACDIDSIGYKLDLKNEKLIGKAKVTKSVIPNEEAFAHLNDLDISKKNAFLLSKRLSGRKR